MYLENSSVRENAFNHLQVFATHLGKKRGQVAIAIGALALSLIAVNAWNKLLGGAFLFGGILVAARFVYRKKSPNSVFWETRWELREYTESGYHHFNSPDKAFTAVRSQGKKYICPEKKGTWTREIFATLLKDKSPHTLISTNERLIVCWGSEGDHRARVWTKNNLTWEEGPSLSGHTDKIVSVAISPDSQSIATSARDRTVRIWSKQNNAYGTNVALESSLNPFTVEFSSDGQALFLHDFWNVGEVWSKDGERWNCALRCAGLKMFPKNSELILTGLSGRVDLLKKNTLRFETIASFDFDGYLRTCAISQDEKLLAVGLNARDAHVVCLWEKTGGKWHGQKSLNGHTDAITNVAISPDKQVIVTSSDDRTTRIWNKTQGVWTTHKVIPHTLTMSSVRRVEFGPNGQLFMRSNSLAPLALWDLFDQPSS